MFQALFTNNNSFSPHNHSMGVVTVMLLTYRSRNRGTRRLCNLPKFTQLVWVGLAVDKPRPAGLKAHCTASDA